jgi:hypothetical protein
VREIKVPRAVFSYTTNNEITPPDLGDELASIITHGFLEKFGNAKQEMWFRRVWLIETSLDSKQFGVSLKFLEKSNEWRLIASTLDWPAKITLRFRNGALNAMLSKK